MPSLFYRRKPIKGLIVETGNTPIIETIDGLRISAWLKKSLRSQHKNSITSIALGDIVEYEIENGLALISAIEKPKSILCRESVRSPHRNKILATNLDQVVIVLSAGHPETPMGLIDRMIVAAQSGNMKAILCFNKMDVMDSELEDLSQIYAGLGYPILKISAEKHENLQELSAILKGKKSILIGLSGVGKTTIIKSLTGKDLSIADLNISSQKGCHTTTHSHLYKIEENTYLADIPGIKQLGFVGKERVDVYFPEIYASSRNCQYSNCTHTKEENCQVKRDLDVKKIDRRRYDSYLKILEEIENDYK